jgi:hypothetical protein
MTSPATDRLTKLVTKRDFIESQLGTSKSYIELEIRGRRVRRSEAIKELEYLNEQIGELDRQHQAKHGSARNRARFRR